VRSPRLGLIGAITLGLGLSAFVPSHAQASTTPLPKKYIIMVEQWSDGYHFNPTKVTVAAGARVRWMNMTDTPHTVVVQNGSWSYTQELPLNVTPGTTFKKAGTYTYRCTLHPWMKGKIVVQ